jgi:hypothetical protein
MPTAPLLRRAAALAALTAVAAGAAGAPANAAAPQAAAKAGLKPSVTLKSTTYTTFGRKAG